MLWECSSLWLSRYFCWWRRFQSVQSLSLVQFYATPGTESVPGFPVHHQLLELAQIHVHRVSDAVQPSHFLPSPSSALSFPASGSSPRSQLFTSGGQSISPHNEYSGLISFRIDSLDLLAVQGTLKSLLQHHSSKASILWRSAFFTSNSHMATGKAIALTIWTFVGKVMSLLFNKMSRLVIAFLPRSKQLLISWLQSPCIH